MGAGIAIEAGILVFIGLFVFTAFAVQGSWGVRRLRWRDITPDRWCRYLVGDGWTRVDDNRLDKGEHSIYIQGIKSDPATYGVIQAAVDEYTPDQRQVIVLVPGVIAGGVVEAMLSRQIIVMPYQKLGEIEAVLLSYHEALAAHRKYEKRLLTEALDPPTPANLLPVAAPAPSPAAAVTDRLIAETENVQCFFRDGGGDSLLIAFNDSWRSGIAGRLQPGIDIGALGYSIVDFVTREPNWFPADDMAALVPAMLQATAGRFPRRVTFGFSQGGYGAIKYSRALGAMATIAFSPQFSIDPRIVKNERFASHFRSHVNIGMAISATDCACIATLFYDPYDQVDARNVALLADNVATQLIRLPFAGHGTSRLFDTPSSLSRVLKATIAGDMADLSKLGTEHRRRNPDRAFLMALYLAETKPALAERLADANRANWQPRLLSHVCYRLAVNGQSRKALSFMEPLAAANIDNEEIQGCAALVAMHAGQIHAAFRFIERARELAPENTKWAHVQAQIAKSQFTVTN